MEPIQFETHPHRYRHLKLETEGDVAAVTLDVQEDGGLDPTYKLKLNSYDLAVDIELADAVERLRFEHPEVRAVVIRSGKDRIFSAGANIYMLAASSHPFKVNFCKFTNETRLGIEEASRESGQRYIAALNGISSGGGYELALAADEILLVDDGNAAVALPEAPLLAVLPGTGGLTRLVDKRKVRRDRADVFSTLVEGVKGKRALEWGLVDRLVPRSRFDEMVQERARALAKTSPRKAEGDGIDLKPLGAERTADRLKYRHVSVTLDERQRTAEIVVRGPEGAQPDSLEAIRQAGSDYWPLAVARELDDALLHLRFNHETLGLLVLKTRGEPESVLAVDRTLEGLAENWLVKEILLKLRRTLKRLDLTARSIFALIEPGSCFAGSLFELALAADRSYMLSAADGPGKDEPPVRIGLGPLNGGLLPMSNGLSRLETRFLEDPELVRQALAHEGLFDAEEAAEYGLVTFIPDDLDWDDEVRIAMEERAGFSPDAMTGMEASLRFAGPETLETKIFGRLSAWQNWIFQRPNAVGGKGALTLYGKQSLPEFDWRRT
ncbi:MAG: 2,3-epoxybenzoyl-CoA dihydrolase [Acidobacteriota bacterium]